MFTTYILYSPSTGKFYTGQWQNIQKRLIEHNTGRSISTRAGKPCKIVYSTSLSTRTEAMMLERKIKKKRG